MKKNKGFTLIELLAVIAILAVILLIAVPMVLSTIASSKKAAHEKSAMFAWEAAELYIATQTTTGAAITSPATITQISPYLSSGATNVTAASFTITNGVITGAPTATVDTVACTWSAANKTSVTCAS